MGHLVNPLSLRLSVNSFWNSNWVLNNNFNYVNIFKKDYILFQFLTWFIKKTKFIKFNILISHYKIYRINGSVFINLYYYNGNIENDNYFYQIFYLNNILKKQKSLKRRDMSSRINNLYSYLFRSILFNLYWKLINSSLNYYLNKVDAKNIYFFNIYNLNFLNITVDAITNYLCLKLQKRYSLNWILRPILKDLNIKVKQKNFLGYKIVCSGRFTRKQIATYMWMRNGSVKLNTITNLIKYSEARVRLKYGICGIKVWINYGLNSNNLLKRNLFLIFPMYLPFKYLINKKSKSVTLFLNYWFYFYIKIVFFKLKSFEFYKNYIFLKIKILLRNIFAKIFSKIYLYKYILNLTNNNKLIISLKPTRINYLFLYK